MSMKESPGHIQGTHTQHAAQQGLGPHPPWDPPLSVRGDWEQQPGGVVGPAGGDQMRLRAEAARLCR